MPEFCDFSFQFPTNWGVTCPFTACPVSQVCTTLHQTADNWDRIAVLLLPKDGATSSTFFREYSIF